MAFTHLSVGIMPSLTLLGIDFHGFPSAIVNGCNVISGQFQDNAVDFKMPGAMPLQLQRSYSGGRCVKSNFLYGWQLNHGAKLLCHKSRHRHDCAVLKGSDRHGVLYRARYHEKCLKCPDSFFKKGVTNCALGEIGAKTNFKNDRLYKKLKGIELVTADRTLYQFVRSWHDPERESKTHAYKLEKLIQTKWQKLAKKAYNFLQ